MTKLYLYSLLNLAIVFSSIAQCNVIRLEYEDKKGKPIFSVRYEYDNNGKLKKIIHPDFITKADNPNHFTEYIYEGDNIKIMNESMPSDKGDGTYKKNSNLYFLDVNGRIKQIKTFNALNGKGTLIYVNNYVYDAEGNVIQKTTFTKMNAIKDSSVFENYVNGRPQVSIYYYFDKKKKKYDSGTKYRYTYDNNNNLIKTERDDNGALVLMNESTFNTEVMNYNDNRLLAYSRVRNNPNFGNKDYDPNMALIFKSYSDYCVIDGVGKKVPLHKSTEAEYENIKFNSKGWVTQYKNEYREYDCEKPKKENSDNTSYYEVEYDCK